MSAKYLFRLDDATSFLNKEKWASIENLFDKHNIKPIVAVTPDNQDPNIKYEDEDPDFWNKVNKWSEKGWSIAMHGYQHLYHYVTKENLIIPFYNRSEFAGLSSEDQKSKISKSLRIFKDNGVMPTVWVAPSHSFDKITLQSLYELTEIRIVSDGIALFPYFKNNFYFIPQQIWDLQDKRFGVWTVCLHPDTMTDEDIKKLSIKLDEQKLSSKVISVKDIDFDKTYNINLLNSFYSIYFWTIFFIKKALKKVINTFFRNKK